jgi:hypothetical protein
MMVVVFGDFGCAFSFLASRRVDHLRAEGIDVTWLAVTRPIGSGRGERPFPGSLHFEVAAVESWLERDEALTLRTPAARPDTSLAVAGLAATHGADADRLRHALFNAYWAEGRDIGDRHVVEELAGRSVPRLALRARRWRRNWMGLGCPDLPAVILEDGTLVRGGPALDELTIERRAPTCSPRRTVERATDEHRNARRGP